MKLMIESDGTAMGTCVKDENGKMIEGVTDVTWAIGKDDKFAQAVITIIEVAVKLKVSKENVIMPEVKDD